MLSPVTVFACRIPPLALPHTRHTLPVIFECVAKGTDGRWPLCRAVLCCSQVSLLEQIDPVTNLPIAVLLGVATNIANGINTATPTLWMDPVSGTNSNNILCGAVGSTASTECKHTGHVALQGAQTVAVMLNKLQQQQWQSCYMHASAPDDIFAPVAAADGAALLSQCVVMSAGDHQLCHQHII